MKAATFNANSIRSRSGIVSQWLRDHKPDILCVQETKAQDQDFPIGDFADCGYEIVFKGEKKYNGVAVFSKEKLTETTYGLDTEPSDPARMICTRAGKIWIVNTYIPQGRSMDSEMFRYKLDWLRRLGDFFRNNFKPSDHILWMGDMNVASDERDVHDPKSLWGSVCYCREVIDGLSEIIDWGFVDIFRKYHQEPEIYTFWDYRVPNGFKRNIGWRIDYIMATRKLAELSVDCWVDTEPRKKEKPSDHTFLAAEFDI